MGKYQFFSIKVEDGVALVTMSRPPVNALSAGLLQELGGVLDEVEGDPEARVLVLVAGEDIRTKSRKMFCGGADISEFGSAWSSGEAREFIGRGQRLLTRIEKFPKVTIAALNGSAFGGGTELAMCFHLRVLAEEAELGQPEVKLGIIPGYGGTQRLPRLMGRTPALYHMLTGDPIPAAEALKHGLVNFVVPLDEVLPKAMELAKRLAQGPPVAQRMVLEAVREGLDRPLDEGLEVELEKMAAVTKTEDTIEGAMAFMQKRPPKFKGK
ncbi:MAG TPA: 3-hydroxybutyryl-CoA dehydrogenase [Clostridiales bacterium]|nr:3-hydroxybutyryl-CoA dehydrogenase [Clostridiales bacterium]